MSDFKVKIEGKEQNATSSTNAIDFYKDTKEVVAAKINGELRDLATPLKAGDEVVGVLANSEEGLAVIRHSTAHILAQLCKKLVPKPN